MLPILQCLLQIAINNAPSYSKSQPTNLGKINHSFGIVIACFFS